MNRLRIAFVCLILANPLAAKIYQWVDTEGQTHYSDTWSANAQQFNVDAGISRPGHRDDYGTRPLAAGVVSSGPYQAFEISTPAENEVLLQELPSVSVGLTIEPPLLPGHRLEIELDGIVMSASGTQFSLQGASYGSHRLSVRALDAEGAVISRTPVRHFHIRKPAAPGMLQ